jgi:hypothetical protein
MTTKTQKLVSLGRAAAAITFTRINNKTVEPRNAGQARAKRISTNHSCVAYFKRPLVLACTFVLGSLAFSVAPALASRPHQFSRTFGTPCLAEPLCTGESLFKPAGVAVNEATGDVYVVDEGEAGTQTGRVVRFNAKGEYLSEFNGSGSLSGTEPGTGTPWSEGKEAGSGGKSGEFKTGRFEAPLEASNRPLTIAVDNTCVLQKWSEPKCNSEDPSHGDVYVVDAGHRVVDKYSPAGEYLGQVTEGEGNPIEEPGVKQRFHRALDGVAIDPEGHVWVWPESRVLQKYDDKTPNGFIESKEVAPPCCGEPGFAIDGLGDFYVRYSGASGNRIAKLNPDGTVAKAELLTEDANAVATDQLADDVLIDNDTSVALLNPAMEVFERLGEENGAKHLKEAAGIGVNASHVGGSVIYVADAGSGVVDEFGPSEPAPPKIESESESVGEVTGDLANLGGEVNPHSEVGEAATRYWFEYGECASLATCASSGYAEAPGSAGEIPGDFNVHAVAFELTGLKAGTTYHFRVAASNGRGEGVPGEERTFTTEGAGGPLTLPDNRGWELVSPPDKQGARIEPISETGVVQAAASGDALTYLANAPTEAEPQGYSNEAQVLSRRGSSAWSSRDIGIPHTSPTGFSQGTGPEYKFFDPELSLSAVQPFGDFIPQLSAEASEPSAYLHSLQEGCGSDCFSPLVTSKAGYANVAETVHFGEEGTCPINDHIACGPEFLGATEDLAHVVLRSGVPLAEGAEPGDLYEWSAGRLSLVSVLPNGEPASTKNDSIGFGDEGGGAARRAISSDGSHVVWSVAGGLSEGLYLRDLTLGTHGETVQLDQAEPCSGCQSGGGVFQIASTDGTRVFFTDTHKLAEDSGTEPVKEHADLYECRIVASPKLACKLTDLTPVHEREGKEEAAEVQGLVLGASEDGEYVYFVAQGVLGEAPNDHGQKAQAKQPNLYLRHGAETRFIATLAGGDGTDWGVRTGTPSTLRSQPTRVSADGRYLELMSEASLTGYDNTDTEGKPTAEVYLYDAASGSLSCASCDPSGARPVGVEYEKLEQGAGGLVGGNGIWPEKALVAANVPGWTAISLGRARYQPRYLSDEGRLFFNTVNALVPQDTNGTQDVYEYEPPGIKGPGGEEDCTTAMSTYSERSGGCVSLISSGSSSKESAFLDASESGDDVFFLTFSKLSPLDTDEAVDVYDAHVCTGASPCIAFPNVQSPPCTTEASCKAAPTPQPSIFGAPASSTFQGLGNPGAAAGVVVKKALTRAQKLAAALKVCQKDRSKSKRAKCQKAAHKRFGPIKRAKKKAKK